MRGTEKQIAWAIEIRNNVIRALDDVCDELAKHAEEDPDAKTSVAIYKEREARLLNEDVYAGDIINLFKDCVFNGDVRHDGLSVLSVYKIHKALTDGEAVLLGRI